MKWLHDGSKYQPDQQIYASFNHQLKKELVTGSTDIFSESVLLQNRHLLNCSRSVKKNIVKR